MAAPAAAARARADSAESRRAESAGLSVASSVRSGVVTVVEPVPDRGPPGAASTLSGPEASGSRNVRYKSKPATTASRPKTEIRQRAGT